MRRLLAAVFILITTAVKAQFYSGTALGEAMAGATASFDGIDAAFYNIAGTAYSPAGIIANYHDKYFIKELSQKNLAALAPALKGTFLLSANYFGYQLYNTTKVDFGYAMQLSKHLAAGVKINWLNIHISEDAEKNNTFGSDVGIIYKPITKWNFGVYIANITNSQFKNCDSIIPTRICTAASYHFTTNSEISTEIEKNSLINGFITKIGIKYAIHKNIDLMCGISNKPLTIATGLGCNINNYKIVITFRHQELLGWMPSVSAQWCIAQK